MQPLLSNYRVNVEFLGTHNNHGLTAGLTFDGEINVDFESGYVQLLIMRVLPEPALKFRYRNFKELEVSWKINGIYRNAREK